MSKFVDELGKNILDMATCGQATPPEHVSTNLVGTPPNIDTNVKPHEQRTKPSVSVPSITNPERNIENIGAMLEHTSSSPDIDEMYTQSIESEHCGLSIQPCASQNVDVNIVNPVDTGKTKCVDAQKEVTNCKIDQEVVCVRKPIQPKDDIIEGKQTHADIIHTTQHIPNIEVPVSCMKSQTVTSNNLEQQNETISNACQRQQKRVTFSSQNLSEHARNITKQQHRDVRLPTKHIVSSKMDVQNTVNILQRVTKNIAPSTIYFFLSMIVIGIVVYIYNKYTENAKYIPITGERNMPHKNEISNQTK